jgi:nucleoid-associated protein YgaU
MSPTYAPTRPHVRTARDIARGLGAALALIAFVGGVPLVLGVVAPLSWPRSWPTWDSLQTALSRPDDGSILVGVLAVTAWIAWATFTASVIVEAGANLRHVRAPSLPLLQWAQHGAASLVTTAGLLLSTAAPALAGGGTSVIASAPGPADVATPSAMTGAAAAMTGSATSMAATPTTMTGTPVAMTGNRPATTAHTEVDRLPVITAARGDTLWSLAERHLGSGQRYTEIRDLNLGRAQPDGGTLTDAHWIYPGWQLRMPTDATDLPARAVATTVTADQGAAVSMHAVAAGDTLWDIAATHLGDGSRYREIFDLNVGVPQATGGALADANLIVPGWRLALPLPADVVADEMGAAPHPQAEDAQPPAAPGTPLREPAVTLPAAPPPALVSEPQALAATAGGSPNAAERDVDEPDDPASESRLFLGLTGLAAVGVIGELARRRRLQHRIRRTGERIALPVPGSLADDAERTLRTATTPLSIPQLKTALLNLATRAYRAERDLPRIGMLVLSDHALELHLVDDDPDAVTPFTATESRIWSAPTAVIADDTRIDDDPDRPEPYPALVTAGHTDDATVILNLEAAGTLVVTGDPEAAHDVLRSLVTELATSDLTGRIGLITGPEFVGLAAASDPARLQCLEPRVALSQHAGRSEAVASVLGSIGVDDTLEARSDRIGDDTWLPVLYVDTVDAAGWTPPTAWSGSVLLTTTALLAAWTLTVAADGVGTLEPFGTHFTPPRLSEANLGRLVELLATATPPSAADGAARRDISDEIADALAAMPAPQAEPASRDTDPHAPALRINVLGPIEILGLPDGARPLGKRSIELLVYLALRGKATGPELDEVLWHGRRVDNQTRNSLLYRTRQRVGTANLPPVDTEGYYRLGQGVVCDWASFQQLVRRGYAEGTEGQMRLQESLRLVRDRPLCGLEGADYAWAENDTQEMISAVADAAHVLSAGLLLVGDHRGALSAATRGLLAEPCSERLYEDAIRAARERGDAEEADRLRSRLRATLESLDPEYVG